MVWKGFEVFLLKEANGKYFQKVLEESYRTIDYSYDILKIQLPKALDGSNVRQPLSNLVS